MYKQEVYAFTVAPSLSLRFSSHSSKRLGSQSVSQTLLIVQHHPRAAASGQREKEREEIAQAFSQGGSSGAQYKRESQRERERAEAEAISRAGRKEGRSISKQILPREEAGGEELRAQREMKRER